MPTSKYKRFGRKHMMDIAKTIRNTRLSLDNRVEVGRALSNYFEQQESTFDREVFMGIVRGVTLDRHTEPYSDVKEEN